MWGVPSNVKISVYSAVKSRNDGFKGSNSFKLLESVIAKKTKAKFEWFYCTFFAWLILYLIAFLQINIAELDEKTGRMTGANKTYALCGKIRGMGESDDSLMRLARKDGIVADS